MEFVRITRIDRSPEINIGDYVEVKGQCRVIGLDGTEHTLAFVRFAHEGRDSIDLTWEDGSDIYIEDDIDWYDDVAEAVVDAIDEIEARATQAAEAAWNEVWVEAAVAAER